MSKTLARTPELPSEFPEGKPEFIKARANILDGTQNRLQNLKEAKLVPTLIPLFNIAGITYLTVTGIQTILGHPPKWVQSLTGTKPSKG